MPSAGSKQPIRPPLASRQVAFHQLLVAARKKWLMEALQEALSVLDQQQVKGEIAAYVPADAQRIVAAAGLRDEHVFPTPSVLKAKPTLLGYYRLLLGVPQKTFYGSGTGMGQFKSMESRGIINDRQATRLGEFCEAMSDGLAELVRQMSPRITAQDVAELPLLTIGAQFQGRNINVIGKQAIVDIFLSIKEIVKRFVKQEGPRELVLVNASRRKVVIALSSDPDVRIQEEFGGALRNKVAIEIKGGTDRSNAHNRAGEAEKSHQKAKKKGFRDFWTIIAKKGLDMERLKSESPTTTSWFDAAQVLGRAGEDWQEFRSRFAGEVGIPLK